jgi:uncharacterized membrane protein
VLSADAAPFVAIVFAGAVYVTLVATQDEPVEAVTWVVTGSVVAAAATAAAGLLADDRRPRALLFAFTAVVALVWAVLGAASVGIAFVPALVLSVHSVVRARQRD